MEQYDPKDLQSTLLYMREEYGRAVFRDPPRMYSVICELAPALQNEGNILQQMASAGILKELEQTALTKDENEQSLAVMKARSWLVNSMFMNEDKADEFQAVIAALYGIKVPEKPPALPPPAVSASASTCGPLSNRKYFVVSGRRWRSDALRRGRDGRLQRRIWR